MHTFFQFYLKRCIAFICIITTVNGTGKKNYKCLDLAADAYLEICFKKVMPKKLINLLRSILLKKGGSVLSWQMYIFLGMQGMQI